uniref:Uncharacterized protein n=1 Tax=Vespula pensylvanica TaxID=30213 RepID=A0A834U3Q7_VESPE|nr:hypothetical protein H0235_011984 [Vespula pensylvanica]
MDVLNRRIPQYRSLDLFIACDADYWVAIKKGSPKTYGVSGEIFRGAIKIEKETTRYNPKRNFFVDSIRYRFVDDDDDDDDDDDEDDDEDNDDVLQFLADFRFDSRVRISVKLREPPDCRRRR